MPLIETHAHHRNHYVDRPREFTRTLLPARSLNFLSVSANRLLISC